MKVGSFEWGCHISFLLHAWISFTKRKRVEKEWYHKSNARNATTYVWITIFSWCWWVSEWLNKHSNFGYIFTKKNPNNPADMLKDGIVIVVKLSFMTMNVNKTHKLLWELSAFPILPPPSSQTPSQTDVPSTSSSPRFFLSSSPLSLLLLFNYDLHLFFSFFFLFLLLIWNTAWCLSFLITFYIRKLYIRRL